MSQAKEKGRVDAITNVPRTNLTSPVRRETTRLLSLHPPENPLHRIRTAAIQIPSRQTHPEEHQTTSKRSATGTEIYSTAAKPNPNPDLKPSPKPKPLPASTRIRIPNPNPNQQTLPTNQRLHTEHPTLHRSALQPMLELRLVPRRRATASGGQRGARPRSRRRHNRPREFLRRTCR